MSEITNHPAGVVNGRLGSSASLTLKTLRRAVTHDSLVTEL